VVGQVRGDEPVDCVRLVQGSQLDEDGDQVGCSLGDAPGHFTQQERLATPCVPQHQQKPWVVGGDEVHELAREVFANILIAAAQFSETLRHVKTRRVDGVVVQPGRLPVDVAAQVE
jgi:hypothetical protein